MEDIEIKDSLIRLLDYDTIINTFGSDGGNSYVYDVLIKDKQPDFYWAEGEWNGKVLVIYNIKLTLEDLEPKYYHIIITDNYFDENIDPWVDITGDDLYHKCVNLIRYNSIVCSSSDELRKIIIDNDFENRHSDFKKEFIEYCKTCSQ